MNTTTLPQELMTNSLLHFENGVPIDDLRLTEKQKSRLARVSHVYWQWKRNPFIDTRAMFRQMVRGKYSNDIHECRVAQRDQLLFDFIRESVMPMTRKEAQQKVIFAAEKAIQIGAETDNITALTKGGKLLADATGLDKPEDNRVDISKVAFLQPVVVTNVCEIDESKEDLSDEQSLAIMKRYNAFIDEKRVMVDDRVKQLEAYSGKSDTEENGGELCQE